MVDDPRQDRSDKSDERRAPDRDEQYEQDELARRREHSTDRPALTRLEREERWPIG